MDHVRATQVNFVSLVDKFFEIVLNAHILPIIYLFTECKIKNFFFRSILAQFKFIRSLHFFLINNEVKNMN